MSIPVTRIAGFCAIFLFCCTTFVRSEPARIPDPVIGRWRWIENQIVVCTTDNKFSVIPTKRTGTWKFVPGTTAGRKYTLTWDDGLFVDTVTMSNDQKKLKGKNQQGKKIEATKIESQ